jgi:bacillopeptidase F (M6 metalloprotease family)
MYASNHVQEDEVAPTKPKENAFNGRHQPKKAKAINKAKGEKRTNIKKTPAKGSPTSSPPKKTKKVWRVK